MNLRWPLLQQERQAGQPLAIVSGSFHGDRCKAIVPVRLAPLHCRRQLFGKCSECSLVGNLEKHEIVSNESVLRSERESGMNGLRGLMAGGKIRSSHDIQLRILGRLGSCLVGHGQKRSTSDCLHDDAGFGTRRYRCP